MNVWKRAACAALLGLPVTGRGQAIDNVADAAIEEIVVTGRTVDTSSERVEVKRRILIDSAVALKAIPGANVNANGPITGIAQYRGMFGWRVATDIDSMGIVSGGPNAMDAPLSYVSPMLTRDIVVERGIAGVAAAPESIGGHISATLDRGEFGGKRFGLSGEAGTRYSDNGDVRTSAGRLTLADRRQRFSAIAERDTGNDISTPAGTIRPSGLKRKRYDLSWGLDSGAQRLLVYAGGLDTKDTGTPSLPMDIRFIDTHLYGLQLDASLSPGFKLEGRLGHNDVDHLMDNFTLRDAPMAMAWRQNLAHGSGTQYRWALSIDRGDFGFHVGVDGNRARHGAVISNPNRAAFRVDNFNRVRRDVAGLFAEVSVSRDTSRLALGLRYKRVRANAGTVAAAGMPEPMGGMVALLADAFNAADRKLRWDSVDAVLKYRYQPSASTHWLLEFGSKTRAPSYQELYLWLPLEATGGLADGRSYLGDLGLRQERSNEVVAGLTSDLGRVSLSPQVFFRRVHHYIQGIPSANAAANRVATMMGGAPALQFANVDAEISGADLAWRAQLGGRVFLDGVASYVRGKRTDLDDNLYRLAPLNGSVGMTYEAENWSLNPEVVYYAEQQKVSSYNGEEPTPAYTLVNVLLRWTPIASLEFEFTMNNVLDKSYQDHLAGINRVAGSDMLIGERLYGPGRTFSLGVLWRF